MGALAPVALAGREAETGVLCEVLGRVASGGSATVLLEGEAGIGKTRLLENTLEDAAARGMRVVAGRADELDRMRPFGLLADAFACSPSSTDPRRAAIASLLATHGGGDRGPITVTSDPGLQFRVVHAFTDLAEALALSGPVVIGVDDLQWADPSSLLAIGAIGRRLRYVPVALIGCFRPAPRGAELERLTGALESAGAQRLPLGPLPDTAVRDLVAQTVGAEPGPGLLAEASGAAGNPLFVTELLGALLQEGTLKITNGRAEVTQTTLPPTLRLTILRRLSFLADDTLRALRAASILGSRFSLSDLAAVTARPALETSLALTEAMRAHVVEDDGTRLRFRHDLLRDSIYEDLPVSVRRGLHREAGQRLARAGAPALQVAEHLARGAAKGDAEAIGWLARAGREASPTAPDVAADLLGRAVCLMDPADQGRDGLLAEQASNLRWAGRVFDAEAACRALLGRNHDPGVEGPARICLGHALLAGGRSRDGLRELELAGQSPALTSAERAIAQAMASHARMWLGDLDGSATLAGQARAAAADPVTTSIAMACSAVVFELRGQLRRALDAVDTAVNLADRSPGRVGFRYALHATRAWILLDLDRLDEARSAIRTGRRISEELGVGWHLPSYQTASAVERFIAGEWDDAIAEVEASAGLADDTGQAYGLILAHSVLSVICLHRNDLTRATEASDAAMGQLAATGPGYRALWALWARALILEAGGKTGDALAVLAGVWDRCARSGLTLDYRVFGIDLVRLALASGDSGRAADVAAAVAETAERSEVSSLTGAALHCRGLAENDPGILQAAVGAYSGGTRPFELALACEDAGAAFARQQDQDRARELLDRALRIYERLDATRDLARAGAVLRGAGIRRGRRGKRGRPRVGWPSLTPTERAVASLVAEGLSNPQIGDRLYISRRTVQTHLAHVFAKLDIGSRAQLAAEATRHRNGEPDRGAASAGL